MKVYKDADEQKGNKSESKLVVCKFNRLFFSFALVVADITS